MEIKVFELEFSFFDGSEWNDIHVKIIAESKIQLIRAFLHSVYCIHEPYQKDIKTQKDMIKKCWNYNKEYISEYTLSFPIVTRK